MFAHLMGSRIASGSCRKGNVPFITLQADTKQHTRPPCIPTAATSADSAPPKTGHPCTHSTPTQPQLLPQHRRGAHSHRPAVPPCLQTEIFLPSGLPNASFRLSASACPSPAGTAAPGEAPVSPAPRCTRASAHVHPSPLLPSWAAATGFVITSPIHPPPLWGNGLQRLQCPTCTRCPIASADACRRGWLCADPRSPYVSQ